MLSKCRQPLISTVHFYRQISFPPFPSSRLLRTYKTALKINDPCYQSHSRLVRSSSESTDPNSSRLFHSYLLKVSIKTGFLHQGKHVHAHIVKSGSYNTLSLQNQILNFYVKCGEFHDAEKLLDEMPVRNVVTWNVLICGVLNGDNKCVAFLGFSYFRRMLLDKIELDHITFNGLLRACVEVGDIEAGRQLHCWVVKLGFDSHCFVGSSLVDLYAKFGSVEAAKRAFDVVLAKDLVLWNVMVSCYALNGLAAASFGFFSLMQLQGVKGDGFTFSSLLNACGNSGCVELGRQIHGLVVKMSLDLATLVASTLVDMYAKSKTINDARKAFDGMVSRNNVSWTTMIVGYGLQGNGKEAMRLLRQMLDRNFYPDELTLASILSSGGNLSATSEIKQVHAFVVKNGFHAFLSVANALINAYSKCGIVTSALQCFRSVTEPDIITWTSIIGAYAFHGLSKESIEIFDQMLSSGVKPDAIAFLGALSACCHGGLVNKGLHYFNLMMNDFQMMPNAEHYTCVIDLLGRAGLLDEAFDVLMSMPIKPRSDTLAAFGRACRIHGNARLAKWAAEKLFELEPNEPANYTLMSNLYASEGHWSNVARMHEVMSQRSDYRAPGCSWIENAGGA